MRLFFEKPRTRIGWKGMLYDPHLDGTYDISAGIRQARKLLLQITEIGVPSASEILEPIAASYFDDLLTWGMIGARTSSSQTHRQIASGLPFPVGFKNDCNGDLDVAISAILTAKTPHTHIGINEKGKIAALTTKGNPLSHLVLRGSETQSNYDLISIAQAMRALQSHSLSTSLIIDCSHGNCGKNHLRQADAFKSIIEQAQTNPSIAGFMLESHLFEGKQPMREDPELLDYGVSITDPCLGWEETVSLLRSISMRSVQN